MARFQTIVTQSNGACLLGTGRKLSSQQDGRSDRILFSHCNDAAQFRTNNAQFIYTAELSVVFNVRKKTVAFCNAEAV